MDNSKLPKGQSSEENGSRKPRNLPGIYRHEAAGKELITSADPNDGSIQADALVRVGYHRIGDVPSRVEINKMREAQLEKDKEAVKAGRPAGFPEFEEEDRIFNGTTSPSTNELIEAKEKAEKELAETKATLEALKEGQKTAEPK